MTTDDAPISLTEEERQRILCWADAYWQEGYMGKGDEPLLTKLGARIHEYSGVEELRACVR